VTDPTRQELERARRELGAARAPLHSGYPEKTVSSADVERWIEGRSAPE
jgi:hypothetical protein